jgi:Family of unknown function (DUF6496)
LLSVTPGFLRYKPAFLLTTFAIDDSSEVYAQEEHSMAVKKKSSRRRYGKAAGKRVASAMRRKKRGTLRSGKGGKGGKVKSRKQAIAIGLSEARKKGAKVPKKS